METITTTCRFFEGQLNTVPISMYLSFTDHSFFHLRNYYVAGWFKYHNTGEPIPLRGMYHSGSLTLFSFPVADSAYFLPDTVANWHEEVMAYTALDGYNQRFSISSNGLGTWTDGTRTLEVMLGANELEVRKNHSFLSANGRQVLDLGNVAAGANQWKFTILAQQEANCLLAYTYHSNPSIMGSCGSGEESGILSLKLDAVYNVLAFERHHLCSCLENRDCGELDSENPDERVIEVIDYGTNTTKRYVLSLSSATLREVVE